MTNQNVVVSELNGLGAVEATVPKDQSTSSSSGVPKLRSILNAGFITVSWKKLQRLGSSKPRKTPNRLSSWVESMRASSPPRVKSSDTTTTNAPISEEYQNSWTVSS